MDNYFGIRFGIIIILVVTLGTSITSATTTKSLLSPMVLFLLPLALDYYSHNPKLGKNISRKNVGIWLPGILSAFLLAVLLSPINLDILTNFLWIKVIFWLPFLYFAVLSGVDWTSYSNPEEKNHREMIQRVMRSEVFDSPQKRVKQYSKVKKRTLDTNEEY